MNIWGYCEHCDRWFRCPMDHAMAWSCPGCGIEPVRIENRALAKASASAPARRA